VSTPLADLADRAGPLPGLAPSGLIFHMSRCGSTLVCQMLAACGANIVVSEPPPIDAIVRSGMGGADRVTSLRAMSGAISHVRSDGETRYFIKLDSWHARALPLFRWAFPATPWVFLYREPAAVMGFPRPAHWHADGRRTRAARASMASIPTRGPGARTTSRRCWV